MPETSPRTRSDADELVRVLAGTGIRDGRVLDAFRTVARDRFVPARYASRAFIDEPVPIPHGQVTSQPSLIALMVEALRLSGTERVLEVGTGLGFQTAILAVLAREVVSVERFADLSRQAAANLEAAAIRNVVLLVGDGSLGAPAHAPFDAIVTSAAAPALPPPMAQQLAEGGRIVHPLGHGGDEVVIAWRKRGDQLLFERRLTLARFVPMVGAFGAERG